ncbi:MAG: mechanosensitive ion channel [Thermodesulfovibrionales bacterium]|nr:mechanosensitive ion channel [Thermodesulfovibrionales bacterium]
MTFLMQLVFTALAVVGGFALNALAESSVRTYGEARGVDTAHQDMLARMLRYSATVLAVIALVLIWGVNIASIWVLGTGLLGFLGVALFATWSFLSSIMSAFIIFFTMPYGVGDQISFHDGSTEREGTIEEMTLFFVHLRDSETTSVKIPNSLILQRSVRVTDRKKDDE